MIIDDNFHVDQVFSNYATALRKVRSFKEAITWYERSLTYNEKDGAVLANLALTLHLMRR